MDVPDTINRVYNKPISTYEEPKIHRGDLIQVSIQTIDPQTNSQIGSSITASNNFIGSIGTSMSSGPNVGGFLVDNNGFIELPLVGRIKIEGLTSSEAKEQIREHARVYFKEPIVNVRFGNFSVSVIGEVNKPGVYQIFNEKATILDALALANDLTIFAERHNILVIRENNGIKAMLRVNINSTDLFSSPFYYLRQGDIVYVEPKKTKAAANDMALVRTVSISTAVASLLSVILSRVK